MFARPLLFFSLILLISGCRQASFQNEQTLAVHPGAITIDGAFALTPLVRVWTNEFQKINPDVKFIVNPMGSGKGLMEVLNGQCDLAMISSEIPSGFDSVLWVYPVTRLAVVPVINRKNPYLEEIRLKGITRDDLADLFSGTAMKTWGDLFGKPGRDPVHVFVRSDSAGASDILARFLWLQPLDLRGKGAAGEDLYMDEIKKDPLALGYCNFIYSFDPATYDFYPELSVIPLDLNNNLKIDPKEDFYHSVSTMQRAMWVGKYPCSLNRELSLVSKTKPGTKEVVEFIKWVLTEGQRYVAREGYIELHSSEIKNMLESLD